MGAAILIAHDDPAVGEALSIFLQGQGFDCTTAPDSPTALRLLRHGAFDLVLFEPGSEREGLEKRARAEFPGTALLPLSSPATDGRRRAAPSRFHLNDELIRGVREALERRTPAGAQEADRGTPGSDPLIGRSPQMKGVLEMIRKLSTAPSTVLVTGESGTGKEVVARALHDACKETRDQKFVAINCAAIPATLMESELFGHVRGAFTGATAEKKGLLETAEGGSLFLDEIGELDIGLQAKLLRAIDRKEVVRVGGVSPIRLDARIMCATNRDLREQISRRLFREDLYFRISVVEIRLAPLRERPEDIPDLVAHFMARLNRELRRKFRGVDPDAMAALMVYEWRGNVRELQNVIERAMILRDGETVGLEDLPAHIARVAAGPPTKLREALRSFEREHIRTVLRQAGSDRDEAARRLGIGVSSLYRKLRALKLTAEEPASRD